MNLKLLVEDPIVLKVMTKFYDRSQRGIEKYGTMLTRTDLNFIDWVTHLQEEMLDAALYCERLKHEYKKNQKDAIINLMNSEYDEMLNIDKGCACYGSNKIHECQCKKG
jgi:hypothetical protein